jgi:hypothetical protein
MTPTLDLNHIIHWFNTVREEENKERILESFWDTQLKSKFWLIKNLDPLVSKNNLNIIIHGGWNGVLASMFFQAMGDKISTIKSIDIDPSTKSISEKINFLELNSGKFESIICDMKDFEYSNVPDVVINTSCEHITDDTLNKWFDKIPSSSIIVCQSNNNLYLKEHISCSTDLDEFKNRCNFKEILFSGNYPCSGYTRFMIIGKK